MRSWALSWVVLTAGCLEANPDWTGLTNTADAGGGEEAGGYEAGTSGEDTAAEDSGTGNHTEDGGTPTGDETGCMEQTWYEDLDQDGYGDTASAMDACEQPPGWVPEGGDCAPLDPQRSPGAAEACDGIDNDCDGAVDEWSDVAPSCNGCDGYPQPQSVLYVCGEPSTYAEAQMRCANRGAVLALPRSAAEAATFDTNLLASLGPGYRVWLGLDDLAQDDRFVDGYGTPIYDDGVPVNGAYVAWGDNEPNGQPGEDCVELFGDGSWNDQICDTNLNAGFVCESMRP